MLDNAPTNRISIVTSLHMIVLLQVRPISFEDFEDSMKTVRPSVTPESLHSLVAWSRQYGAT